MITEKQKACMKKYRDAHKEEINEYSKNYQRQKRLYMSKEEKEVLLKKNREAAHKNRHNSIAYKIRVEFLKMYGNVCSCCGESIIEFLTLEHIEGQKGKKRESSINAYKKAISEYRPDLYETLCMNCNWAKRHKEICPHKLLKRNEIKAIEIDPYMKFAEGNLKDIPQF